jgi:hypothetical protein
MRAFAVPDEPSARAGSLFITSRENQMSYVTDPAQWSLCYLRGRAEAFMRGRLTMANVLGAARRARALGADHRDIAALLDRYGLRWDMEHGVPHPP